MGVCEYQFKEREQGLDLPQCGKVYRYLEEPLVVVEVKGELRDFVASVDLEHLREKENCQYMLFVADNQEEVRLFFSSGTREIRALEFLDSLIPEFGLVKGSAECAEGLISAAVLKVKMANVEISEVTEYFLKQIADMERLINRIVYKGTNPVTARRHTDCVGIKFVFEITNIDFLVCKSGKTFFIIGFCVKKGDYFH